MDRAYYTVVFGDDRISMQRAIAVFWVGYIVQHHAINMGSWQFRQKQILNESHTASKFRIFVQNASHTAPFHLDLLSKWMA